MRFSSLLLALLTLTLSLSCATRGRPSPLAIRPIAVTAPVANDADDPAIWINRADPAASLIVGTNKVAAPDGALYVFRMDGTVSQIVKPLDRPNNVDVEYGIRTTAGSIDIVVVTERLQHRLRVFQVSASGLLAIDGGGIPVLEGQSGEAAEPMGLSLFRRPDGAVFAIVAPKTGGTTNYLWQYRLAVEESSGLVRGTFVRRFGNYSGAGEIEAIAVDDALGYVYYSDEEYALRKWHADPDHRDAALELAVFGRTGFRQQREGIAIVARPDGTGLIVCSDQIPGGTELRLFRREGQPGRPHDHDPGVAMVPTIADSTDGLDIVSAGLGAPFAEGLLVMMHSRGRVFQLYRWQDVAGFLAGPQLSSR